MLSFSTILIQPLQMKGEFEIQYDGNLILKISAIGFEDLIDTLHVNHDMDVISVK